MSYYLKEIMRIKKCCYSNQGQMNTIIGTRHYIDQHFDKELKLEQLSLVRFTSKFHLLRLFKRYYGYTPKQYLTEKRLSNAKIMLREGMSVMDTCYSIGFESPSSFSTLFKGRFGKSPSEFQKEQFSQSEKAPGFEILQSIKSEK